MKTVQDKDGNEIEVADDTPCHPGSVVGGVETLPRPYDPVIDAKILDEAEEKEVEYLADAPMRELEKVIAARNKERGSLVEQWEYFIDNGYTKLKERDDQIKLNNPKGEL